MTPSIIDMEKVVEQAWKVAVVSKKDFKMLSFLLARDKMENRDDLIIFDDHLKVDSIEGDEITVIFGGNDVFRSMTFRGGFGSNPIDFELLFDEYPWQFFDDEGHIAILTEDSLMFLGAGIREPGKEERGSNLCIRSN